MNKRAAKAIRKFIDVITLEGFHLPDGTVKHYDGDHKRRVYRHAKRNFLEVPKKDRVKKLLLLGELLLTDYHKHQPNRSIEKEAASDKVAPAEVAPSI
jgi:hypothetical protein